MKKFSFFLLAVFLTATSFSQELISIGTGISSDHSSCPMLGNYYGYERHAVLYTNAEIQNGNVSYIISAQITKIAFNLSRVNAPTANRSHKIYIKEVAETALTTAMFSDWATLTASATEVYNQQGTNAILTTGWNEFTLSTPFPYNGGSILIFTDNVANGTSGDDLSYCNSFYFTAGQTGKHWYSKQDYTPLNNTTIGTVDAYRANIQITLQSVVQAPCLPG